MNNLNLYSSVFDVIFAPFVFLWNLITGILSFAFSSVTTIISFVWGLFTGIIKLCLAPFLAIWFFFFPPAVTAKTPPQISNQSNIATHNSTSVEHNDSLIEIFQNPVDLKIDRWYKNGATVYVQVTVKNHEVPFLQVSSDRFSLTDDNNTTSKSASYILKPGMSIISSREVAEDGKTTGWLAFDMGDAYSQHHVLKFNYGLFKEASVKF